MHRLGSAGPVARLLSAGQRWLLGTESRGLRGWFVMSGHDIESGSS
jgi:hypothetical protein